MESKAGTMRHGLSVVVKTDRCLPPCHRHFKHALCRWELEYRSQHNSEIFLLLYFCFTTNQRYLPIHKIQTWVYKTIPILSATEIQIGNPHVFILTLKKCCCTRTWLTDRFLVKKKIASLPSPHTTLDNDLLALSGCTYTLIVSHP